MKRIFAALLMPASIACAGTIDLEARQYGDFDEYVFAVTWQPGFCQGKYEGLGANPEDTLPVECNPLPRMNNKIDYLTVHGLWPSLPKSIDAKMGAVQPRDKEARWRSDGCAVDVLGHEKFGPEGKCEAPKILLPETTAQLLRLHMPGANENSCLDRYEYAKHGICFDFDKEKYFGAMVQLISGFRKSAVAELIASRYGESFSIQELRTAIEKSYGKDAESAIAASCTEKNGKSFLSELQITIRKDKLKDGLEPGQTALAKSGSQDKPSNEKGRCGRMIHVDTRGF